MGVFNCIIGDASIPLPAHSAPKPRSAINAIPPGTMITDDELVNGVSIKIAASIVECATGQAQAIRSDVGMIWALISIRNANV
ncbi:MAG TPA: hypothetical protein VJ546_00695 [Bacillales bacterium]|nr:hypothetical protein [Bacillales bacterium]